MYKESLPIRKNFLIGEKLFDSVNDYIEKGVNQSNKNNADVVSLLCIKYMYFVRNKVAHAEKADQGFIFIHQSAMENEINWMLPFLRALVIDLINISSTFSPPP